MAGMEDLKPAKVIDLKLLALCRKDDGSHEVREFEVYIGPTGSLMAKPSTPDTTNDQTPLTDEQREERIAKRWSGIDQV